MTPLDAAVVAAYLLGILAISWHIASRQVNGEDYFLAGRRMGGGTLAMSIMANQASAVSLIGAPAYVAVQQGGGLRWLQYELALPLAMVAVIAFLLPVIRSANGASIYEYLGQRFGIGTRRAMAIVFLASRGLALGVVLYASGLAVAGTFGWSIQTSMMVVGGFALVYTGLGGIAADIWSDVLQLAVLWGGTVAACGYLLARHGSSLIAAVPPERMDTIVAGWGIGPDRTFSLAPMLVGSFFLYVSYYGCDQTQAQRLLTARSDAAASNALVLNGLLRFPLVLTYCLLGVLLAGLLHADAAFATAMAGQPADMLVPLFIRDYLPAGLRGLFLAAILAAAMSSIDSALNSLAAITLEDVIGVRPSHQSAWLGRVTTAAWGVFAMVSGLALARSGQGILDLINRSGSLFYGPVLAVFLLGVLSRRAGGVTAMLGLVIGLSVNALVATLFPAVSWLWWNPIGFVAAFVPAMLSTGSLDTRSVRIGPEAPVLVAAFGAMVLILIVIGSAATGFR